MSKYEHYQFEPINEEMTKIADVLIRNYGGHTSIENLMGLNHLTVSSPALVTEPLWDADAIDQTYTLSVIDGTNMGRPIELGNWAARQPETSRMTTKQMNTFEARLQRGIILIKDSGLLFYQFYPPLLREQPVAENMELAAEEGAK